MIHCCFSTLVVPDMHFSLPIATAIFFPLNYWLSFSWA